MSGSLELSRSQDGDLWSTGAQVHWVSGQDCWFSGSLLDHRITGPPLTVLQGTLDVLKFVDNAQAVWE